MKSNHDGFILINKPEGLSSNKVVNIVKRLVSAKKAGHTGTLDPFATGLLPVCINRGTKLARYLINKEKEYKGLIKLGTETDTLDKTGTIVKSADVPDILLDDALESCRKFTGKISQVPPAYSALKHNGVPLYKHARKGNIIIKESREITIHELEILKFALPEIEVRVKCSAGTYIRSLARDIAQNLGTCGHLQELERSACGSLSLKSAITLDELENSDTEELLAAKLIPLEKVVDFMPEIEVEDELIPHIFNGKKIYAEDIANNFNIIEDIPLKIVSKEKRLLSIVRKEKNINFFRYDVVFN